MQLDLTEEEARALADLLNTTVEGDTYQGSRCVRMFRTTLAKLVLMMRVLEEGKRVAAEAAGAAVAELDRQELERELRAVSTNGEFDRQALEPELQWCGLEGDGFEPLVPRHKSRGFPEHSGHCAGYRRARKRYHLMVQPFFSCASSHSSEPGWGTV